MRFTAILVVLVAAIAIVSASDTEFILPAATYVTMFKSFITKARRTFSAANFAKKLEVFKRNVDRITNLNKGKGKVKFGVNNLADYSPEEFRQLLGARLPPGFRQPPGRSGASFIAGASDVDVDADADAERPRSTPTPAPHVTIPAAFDWTNVNGKNHFGKATYQDSCGSCWAFTAAANLEAQLSIKLGKTVKLSEQAILSCSGAGTCQGGWYYSIFDTIKSGKTRMVTQAAFPYKNQQTPEICEKVKADTSVEGKITAYGRVKETHNDLALSLVNNGPVSIAIDANEIQFYKEGIVPPQNCNVQMNHAVVLVGYGGSGADRFWKIRNSWGSWWGENGYYRIHRDEKVNSCFIYTYAYYATVSA